MTNLQTTPAGAALVAVDVAKLRNEVLIEVPEAGRRRRLSVPNSRVEHDRLVAALQALGRPVVVGFEPTGHYHRPLAWRLSQAGFELRLVSSVALARTREALHNGWDKNDPKDAQVILHMLRIGAAKPYHDPLAHGINDIQELSKTHEVVSRAKTEVLHRIQTHYLPPYFPEIGRFLNSTRNAWFFALLDRFPVPAGITAWARRRSSRRLGTSPGARSPRPACSATSTTPRRAPSPCPSPRMPRPSPCSASSSPRRGT